MKVCGVWSVKVRLHQKGAILYHRKPIHRASPPCGSCGDDVITISGIAYTGERVELQITDWGFLYSGRAQDIERLRKGLCLYDKPTARAEKAK